MKIWTADRLAKRGLNHPPKCPLCDQIEETIDHLLVSCVFTRQFWFIILQQFGLQAAAPQLISALWIGGEELATCFLVRVKKELILSLS